jgi:hypothetical protein
MDSVAGSRNEEKYKLLVRRWNWRDVTLLSAAWETFWGVILSRWTWFLEVKRFERLPRARKQASNWCIHVTRREEAERDLELRE